jgi:methylmalonyl-CoA/ethylmalonyl-CoA epimerase
MSRRSRLHHVGFAVTSISATAPSFIESFGADWDGTVIHDPIQRARVTFFSTNEGDPLVELVEPNDERSPLATFIEKKGGGLHHLCYEVPDVAAELTRIRAAGGLVVSDPVPATAFQGRRIAWAYTKDRVLLEYLEA